MRSPQRVAILLLACSFAAAPPAAAQGAAGGQELETSIRAAGMGGATTGVGWGEPGPWGNPASLARTRGLAWLAGITDILPQLQNEVTFETRRYLMGGAGLGFSLMGEPVSGMGGSRLHYASEGTDPFGNPFAYQSFEQIEGWGVGLSPVQVLDAFRLQRDSEAPLWSQRADVSFGYQHKQTYVALAPGFEASADNFDWGVQAQFAVLPGDREARQARLEIGAGYAVLNADTESQFGFAPSPGSVPSTLMKRAGVSVHASLPLTGAGDDAAGPWGWWFATVPRALDLGLAYDRENLTVGGISDKDVAHVGFEVSVMGVLTGRLGFVDNPTDEIQDMSFGFGLHLPVGPWASLGYDLAQVPLPEGFSSQTHHGFAVWLHPVSWWNSTRE